MNITDCIKFANENPVCYVATVDGNQPRVRAFGMWFADETGFYFSTGAVKPVYRQLQANSNVEVCFYAPMPEGIGPMLRVTGQAEFLNDTSLKERLLNDMPFLRNIVSGPDDPMLAIMRISKGECTYWTMSTEFREQSEKIVF